MKSLWTLLVFAVVWLATSPTALACATCFGQSDDKMAEGMNAGIITMLFVVGGVLTAVAGFFVYIIRRAARQAAVETAFEL